MQIPKSNRYLKIWVVFKNDIEHPKTFWSAKHEAPNKTTKDGMIKRAVGFISRLQSHIKVATVYEVETDRVIYKFPNN